MAAPYKLAIFKDGQYLTGQQAYDNLPEGFTLPYLTPSVSKQITVGYGQYPWVDYDRNNPPVEPWEYGYEAQSIEGYLYQRIPLAYAESWYLLNIVRYRKMKQYSTAPIREPNPQYEIVEAEREAQKQLYIATLKSTFIMLGTFSGGMKPETDQANHPSWERLYFKNFVLLTPADYRIRRILGI